jgi:hypothetical protein
MSLSVVEVVSYLETRGVRFKVENAAIKGRINCCKLTSASESTGFERR